MPQQVVIKNLNTPENTDRLFRKGGFRKFPAGLVTPYMRGPHVLEIGSGDGHVARQYAGYLLGKGWQIETYSGWDYSQEGNIQSGDKLRTFEKQFGENTLRPFVHWGFYEVDIRKQTIDDYRVGGRIPDQIVCIETLEHFRDPWKWLANFTIASPRVLISVPNGKTPSPWHLFIFNTDKVTKFWLQHQKRLDLQFYHAKKFLIFELTHKGVV